MKQRTGSLWRALRSPRLDPDEECAQRRERLQELLEDTSRTFALSIPLLPEPTVAEVTVAYLVFRIADTFEDSDRWDGARRIAALGDFAELLREPDGERAATLAAAWTRQPPCAHDGYVDLLRSTPEVMAALGDLEPGAREIVVHHSRRTAERMASFVARSDPERGLQLADLAELESYCYAVAGIVGEMLTDLFIHDWPQLAPVAETLRARAARFGEALQLVNILKDSSSDAREGRRYLPEAVDRDAVFTLAHSDLDRAAEYIRALQGAAAPDGLVAFNALPVLLARATLDRVAEDGPGAKLSRPEVYRIQRSMERAITTGSPVV